MTDNEFWIILVAQIQAVLTLTGHSEVVVQQNFSPVDEGPAPDSQPTWYLHSIGARRHGWQGREEVYDDQTGITTKTECWWLERTMQLNVLALNDFTNIAALTPWDYLDIAGSLLQLDEFVQGMMANGIGLERILDIRQTYVLDDRDQWDSHASLDFVVTYLQTLVTVIPNATVTGTVLEVSQIPGG